MSDKFEFIDVEYAAYQESDEQYVPSIVKMCIWMEVSRSGFYGWRDKPESATAKRRGVLALYIRKSFEDSDDTYGYRRVHADLAAWGVPAGPELVRSLMRELGLEPCQPRPWRVSLTEGDGQEHDIPDLVDRDFAAGSPGEKMVGDITYIPTWEGWLFLATVIDCHTKAVIGWAADDNYKTPLIERAIEMAARNYPLAENAIFHSDRGSNYTSCQFAATLKRYGIRQSVGRTGICYDNAMAESFFAALKNERVHRTQYPTRDHARRDVVRYIEFWYNSRRRHSGLQYRTPQQVHDESWNSRSQRKLTVNQLSGKLGADQISSATARQPQAILTRRQARPAIRPTARPAIRPARPAIRPARPAIRPARPTARPAIRPTIRSCIPPAARAGAGALTVPSSTGQEQLCNTPAREASPNFETAPPSDTTRGRSHPRRPSRGRAGGHPPGRPAGQRGRRRNPRTAEPAGTKSDSRPKGFSPLWLP